MPVPTFDLPSEGRVVVAGDWHGDGGGATSVIARSARQGGRTILHVGDFGVGPWPGDNGRDACTAYVDKHLVACDAWLLLTPGNHENWDTIEAAPLDDQGRRVLAERVLALPRGYRWDMGGRTFGSLGGAFSIDWRDREPGQTWWPQELIRAEHVDALGDAPLDVLITHDAPAGVPVASPFAVRPDVHVQAGAGRWLLHEAITSTRPKVVFCGHWHQRTTAKVEGARVEVLDAERTPGNAVVLDLSDLSVRPL